MSEWSSSSKGRRGETSSRFTTLMSSVATCSRRLTSLLLCRILQFPRPVKLDDLRAKAKVAFGQTMDLHYTNNEVWSQKNSQTCTIFKISWNKKKVYLHQSSNFLFFLAVGDSIDHSGRPRQGGGAAGSKRSHEESEDPPGAPESLSGQQIQSNGRKNTLSVDFKFKIYLDYIIDDDI